MSTRTRSVSATVVLLLALTACSPGKGIDEGSASSSVPGDGSGSACTPADGEATAKALLRCGERSVAFIETPYATGTGVVVEVDDETYIVTNLHVVDPFDAASVVLGGEEDLGHLPVLGADVAADIALLGPLGAVDAEPIRMGDPDVQKGDEVFLVGFPGAIDARQADLTITSGLVSRTRRADAWDQTYLQSDAVIGDGQSGGALFAATGEVVGISGLSYDPAFALALSVQDVDDAVRGILDHGGDDLIRVPAEARDANPDEGGALSGTVSFADDLESPVLYLPPSDRARTWNLSVSGPADRFLVGVADATTGEPLAVNAAGLALAGEMMRASAEQMGIAPEMLADDFLTDPGPEVTARERSPGVFSIDVAPDHAVEVTFAVASDAVPAEIRWTSDHPLWLLTEDHEPTTLTVGEPVDGTVSGYRSGVPFRVELEAGQRVELSASSPQGDVALAVAGPGRRLVSLDVQLGRPIEGISWFDDSDEGLYGLDVLESFTAPESGTYTLWLQNYELTPLAFRLSVTAERERIGGPRTP